MGNYKLIWIQIHEVLVEVNSLPLNLAQIGETSAHNGGGNPEAKTDDIIGMPYRLRIILYLNKEYDSDG